MTFYKKYVPFLFAITLLSACASNVPVGAGVKAALDNTYSFKTENTRASDKCRFAIKSVENSTRTSVDVQIGTKRDAERIYVESSLSLRPSDLQVYGPSNSSSTGFANPGDILYCKLIKPGSNTRMTPIGRMPRNCNGDVGNTLPSLYMNVNIGEVFGKTVCYRAP